MTAPLLLPAALLLTGVHVAAQFEAVPSPGLVAAGGLGVAILSLFTGSSRWRRLRLGSAWALGLLATGAALLIADATANLDSRLDEAQSGRDIVTRVRIIDFPQTGAVTRLLVEPVEAPELPPRVRLGWYDATASPRLGECWTMTLRLRRPRGFANPGRFDYEQWLFLKRIGATGYVRQAERTPACDRSGVLADLRQRVLQRMRSVLPDDDRSAVLIAVTLGVRHWIDDRLWQRFAATGTGHLMAISGMHIALAAGAMFITARLLLAVAGIAGEHRRPAMVVALAFAVFYAGMSGFGIPARRATLMLLVGVAALLAARRASGWQVFAIVLIVAVISAPVDALSAGFMLSFSAVALLIHQARLRPAPPYAGAEAWARLRHSAAGLLGLQLCLLFGLLPLTAGLFGRVSLAAPLANLLAIPAFGFLVLPAALAGAMLFNGPGDFLLLFAWHAIGVLLWFLNGLASLPQLDYPVAGLDAYGMAAACLALAATVLPTGWPLRHIRWLALGLLLFRPVDTPPHGCMDVDVLDVGQGLSVVLRTAGATMVYDTGPAFRSGSDTGQLVLAPFLAHLGIRQIDLLIVSHDDLDHSGGLRSLDALPPVRAVLRGEPSRLGDPLAPGIPCEAGQFWFRDGLRFRVLSPRADSTATGNNRSCVLQIDAAGRALLLTGDIEAATERQLVRERLVGPVDLLLIPHHGSKTSSHVGLVERTSPAIAIASAGHQNRWGMPSEEVIQRWAATGATVLSTSSAGAIGARLCPDTGVTVRYRQRMDDRRLWHENY